MALRGVNLSLTWVDSEQAAVRAAIVQGHRNACKAASAFDSVNSKFFYFCSTRPHTRLPVRFRTRRTTPGGC